MPLVTQKLDELNKTRAWMVTVQTGYTAQEALMDTLIAANIAEKPSDVQYADELAKAKAGLTATKAQVTADIAKMDVLITAEQAWITSLGF